MKKLLSVPALILLSGACYAAETKIFPAVAYPASVQSFVQTPNFCARLTARKDRAVLRRLVMITLQQLGTPFLTCQEAPKTCRSIPLSR